MPFLLFPIRGESHPALPRLRIGLHIEQEPGVLPAGSSKVLFEQQTNALCNAVSLANHSQSTFCHHSVHHGEDELAKFFLSNTRPFTNVNALYEQLTRMKMGDWVIINRETEAKRWEPITFCARTGLHLLYWASLQKTDTDRGAVERHLKEQTERIGRIYDGEGSKEHIWPFIETFGLSDSLAELVRPDPEDYVSFNDFFSRELKSVARPVTDS